MFERMFPSLSPRRRASAGSPGKFGSMRRHHLEILETRRLLAANLRLQESTPLHFLAKAGDDSPAAFARSPHSAEIVSPAQVVEFDPSTRTEVVRPVNLADLQFVDSMESAAQEMGYEGLSDLVSSWSDGTYGPGGQDGKRGEDKDTDGPGFRYIFGDDGRTRVSDTTAYPYRTVGKQWQEFGTSTYTCSGAMIGAFHFLTAGHCVHDGNGGSWMDDVTISPGQDGDYLGGTRSDDQFYGESSWQYVRTFTGWTQSGNWDWDIAVVTLDRNLGDHTGWLGYGYNTDNNYYNNTARTSGYPGDLNNWTDGMGQYTQTGNARSYNISTHLLRTDTMDVWPGQSGSSLWYTTSGTVSHGVASHHTTIGGVPAYNAFTRITADKFNSIQSWKAADATDRPPTDRPDLVDYDDWFDTDFKGVSDTTLTQGQSFSATTYTRNNGTEVTGDYTVRFRLSSNTTYEVSDTFVGDVSMSSLNPFSWSTVSADLQVPNDMAGGSYYLVYSIDAFGDSAEFDEGNNRSRIPALIQVSVDTNDQISEASNASIGGSVSGAISPGWDVDMYQFTVSQGQRVGFDLDRAASSSLDSVLRLFDENGVELAVSDDDPGPDPEGSGLESYIEHTFATAGTYYLGVSAYANFSYNPLTGGGDSEGANLGGYIVFLNDIPQNSPPTDIGLDNDSIHENLSMESNRLIGLLAAVDADADDSHTFSLVDGAGDDHNDDFLISGDQLLLRAGAELDYEVQSSFAFRVRAVDQAGESVEKPMLVQVTDLGEIESIKIGDGTAQRSRVEQVQVVFDGLMSINAGAFELLKRGAQGGAVDLIVNSAEVDGRTVATLTFTGEFVEHGSLVDGNYQLNMVGEEILDVDGNALDANRDGVFGGSRQFGSNQADNFFRYYGDQSGDRSVNFLDFLGFRGTFGLADDDEGFKGEFDFDASGAVNFLDFLALRDRFGTSLNFE
ncbi:pre-peptidase C-terminal domain-containing protein [Planctomycetaceae bacterium SH139]